MLFVCLIKVLDSLGLMGVESGNDNLGGLAGTCALVTVMDGITSFPLASCALHSCAFASREGVRGRSSRVLAANLWPHTWARAHTQMRIAQVVYDRSNIHWPIVLPYMVATLSTIQIGISILALTVSAQVCTYVCMSRLCAGCPSPH
jgi:hypothetical protein